MPIIAAVHLDRNNSMTTNASNPWLTIIATASLTALGWFYAEYSHNDRSVVQRMSTVEQHQIDSDKRIDDMKTDLQYIRDRLDELIAKQK